MLSEIISKNIISIHNGKVLGTCKDIILSKDLKKIKGYVIFDDDSDMDKFLPIKCVYNIADAIMVKNEEVYIEELPYYVPNNPIGKLAMDTSGNIFGRVLDVYNEEKTVKKLLLSCLEIRIEDLLSEGDNIIVKGEDENAGFFRPKKKKISLIAGLGDNMPVVKILSEKKDLPVIPPKLTGESQLLIGKMATNDVVGRNYELIIRKGEIITDRTINKAKMLGSVNLLLFNSK